MPSTLADLKLEIQKQTEHLEELRRQAEELRDEERSAVLETVRQQIRDFALTAAELGLEAGRKTAGKRGAKATAGTARYVGPEGQTWTGGRGRKPRWITEALAEGKSLTDFERKAR